VNFDRELSVWFEEVLAPAWREASLRAIAATAAWAREPPSSARIPFLIF
jgi:hypothetical protein